MKNRLILNTFHFKFIGLVWIITIIFSCENPNPKLGQLPPITTEGKGTFGYKVDGEVQGQCYEGLFTSLAKSEVVGDTLLTVGTSCDGHTISLVIYNDYYKKGKNINLNSQYSYLRYSPPGGGTFISYDNDNSNASLILLEFDTISKIISGTFSGLLHNEEGESLEITEGRFDLIYKEY